jgi:hypothetical protein
MGRNHNLFGGVRIGAPMEYNNALIDADDVTNGRPIRNVAERHRTASTFLPSVDWTFGEITDTTPDYDTSSSGTEYVSYTGNWSDGPKSCYMQPDGEKMWVIGDAGTGSNIEVYTLSVPFEIASADFNNPDTTANGFDHWRMRSQAGGQLSSIQGFEWSIDGNYAYWSQTSVLYQYNASAPFTMTPDDTGRSVDADSANSIRNSDSSYALSTNRKNWCWSRDGRYLIVSSTTTTGQNRFLNKFELTTPWDLSTRTNGDDAIQSIDASSISLFADDSQWNYCQPVFSPDGTRLFIGRTGYSKIIYQFELSNPWDLTTINPTPLDSWTPNDASSINMSVTHDGKYWYFVNTASGSTTIIARYSQVKHGGNI